MDAARFEQLVALELLPPGLGYGLVLRSEKSGEVCSEHLVLLPLLEQVDSLLKDGRAWLKLYANPRVLSHSHEYVRSFDGMATDFPTRTVRESQA